MIFICSYVTCYETNLSKQNESYRNSLYSIRFKFYRTKPIESNWDTVDSTIIEEILWLKSKPSLCITHYSCRWICILLYKSLFLLSWSIPRALSSDSFSYLLEIIRDSIYIPSFTWISILHALMFRYISFILFRSLFMYPFPSTVWEWEKWRNRKNRKIAVADLKIEYTNFWTS